MKDAPTVDYSVPIEDFLARKGSAKVVQKIRDHITGVATKHKRDATPLTDVVLYLGAVHKQYHDAIQKIAEAEMREILPAHGIRGNVTLHLSNKKPLNGSATQSLAMDRAVHDQKLVDGPRLADTDPDMILQPLSKTP